MALLENTSGFFDGHAAVANKLDGGSNGDNNGRVGTHDESKDRVLLLNVDNRNGSENEVTVLKNKDKIITVNNESDKNGKLDIENVSEIKYTSKEGDNP